MSQLTFSDVATLWKADKRQWVKPASYAVYLQLCNHSLLPVFGDKKALDEALIQSQVNLLLSHGYSIKTVKDTMLVLRMILRYGEKLKVWSHLEFSVHYPTQADGSSPAQTLSIQQQRLLLKHLQGHLSFRNLGLRICLETGLRIGEIYIESKCDYKTVSSILGHASLSTTMDLYVHPDFAEKKKVIGKMTRRLRM